MKQILHFLFFIIFSSPSPLYTSFHYALAIFVEAPHLSYRDTQSLLYSLQKRKRKCPQKNAFGHAWVQILRFLPQEKTEEVLWEGSLSGEREGTSYFEALDHYFESRELLLRKEKKRADLAKESPIDLLTKSLPNGYLQRGSGGHEPTYGAAILLSEKQTLDLLYFVDSPIYPYVHYSLTQHQCVDFVTQVAALVGWILPHRITLPINSSITFEKKQYTLCKDQNDRSLSFSSPDRLEESLKESVRVHFAFYKQKDHLSMR